MGVTSGGVNLLERRPNTLAASSPNKLDTRRIKSATGVVGGGRGGDGGGRSGDGGDSLRSSLHDFVGGGGGSGGGGGGGGKIKLGDVSSPGSFTFLAAATAKTSEQTMASPGKQEQLQQQRRDRCEVMLAGAAASATAVSGTAMASPRCGGFLTLTPRKPNSYLTAELKGKKKEGRNST